MTLKSTLWIALAAVLSACALPPPIDSRPMEQGRAEVAWAGAVPVEALNPDVHQDNIQTTICNAGYTAAVRPSTTYTNGVKAKLMREQSIAATRASEFELDHHIPLALGGHPRSIKNLMLQPWDGADSAKKKDRLERKLHLLVCAGKLMLDDARRAIWFDWQAAYRTFVAN